MTKKVASVDPYSSLYQDLYSLGIFDRNINGNLHILEKNDEHKTILIERRYVDLSGNLVISGFYFIQCLYFICETEHIRKFRGNLEIVVKKKAKGNYMEVDPIILARGYKEDVSHFIANYNEIQRRKPIQLFIFG